MNSSIQALVLAAGKSSRFSGSTTKLLAPLCGQQMLLYPLHVLEACAIPITLVVGHQKEDIINAVTPHLTQAFTIVEQAQQRGTGHAVICTADTWHADHILIINGDVPLITHTLIQELYREHCARNVAVSCVTAIPEPHVQHQYGKVIHTADTVAIVEARDYAQQSLDFCCINAGIYLIQRTFLQEAYQQLELHENSQEWYITDLIAQAHSQQRGVHIHHAPFDTVRGVNTVGELMAAETILRQRIIKKHIANGVYFQQPETVIIDTQVQIEPGASIGAGVVLAGQTSIAAGAKINAYCVINNSHVKAHAQVGPFAHLRNRSVLEPYATIGNFVETSASSIGAHSKAKHLSYLGNAVIGNHVNIGAGTITCNFDGVTKNTTTIQDHAHIGSNNAFIAPVTVGHDAVTGAGSVITEDVPAYALAIARARQVTKEHYVQKQTEQSFIPKELE